MNQTTFVFVITIDTKLYNAQSILKCLETDPDTLKNIWWKYIPSLLQKLYSDCKIHCLDIDNSSNKVFDITLSVSIDNEELIVESHTSNIQPIDLENPIELLIESEVEEPIESSFALLDVHIEPDEPINLGNIVHADKTYMKYANWYGRHTNWNNL